LTPKFNIMEIILKYFKNLNDRQKEQFAMLYDLYVEWNAKINVISRKDIDNLYEKHVLHSLAIGKFINFTSGTQVLDVGTGGGFPGIPLAILFPAVKFHLIDSIGKKIKVVQGVSEALGLTNCTSQQIRSNELKQKFDFIVSRGVSEIPEFVANVRNCLHHTCRNSMPNGIIYLKGGNITGEIQPFQKDVFVQKISDYFKEEFFYEKMVVYLQI
jgi:16S rRNA (guanine527-N7)-methyltransferase